MLPNKKFSVAKDHGKSYINDTPSLDHHKIALGSCKNNRILKKILIPPTPTVLAPPPKRGGGGGSKWICMNIILMEMGKPVLWRDKWKNRAKTEKKF